MTLAVDSETVSKTLWPLRAQTEAPVQEDGQLLRIHAARPHDTFFTCAAVSPIDESCYALGTSNGAVYGLSLRENGLFLVARTGLPVRCLSFCGGVAFQTLALALEGNVVVFCDWSTGRVLQRFQVMAHERPISSIVVSADAPTLTLLVSADKMTCWTPVATSMDTSNYQYTCIGGTSPSQILYHLLPASATVDGAQSATQASSSWAQEPPRFVAAHLFDAYLLTTETNGVVSLWSHERRSRAGGGPSALHETVQLQCSLRTTHDFPTRCSATSPNYLALGARNAPVVALLRHTHTPDYALESLMLVRVAEVPVAPSHRPSPAGVPAAALSVVQLAFIGSELIAVLLSDQRLVFVALRTRCIAFDIALPALDRTPLQSGARAAAAGPTPYQLCLNGSTFAVVQSEADAYVYHLPTARNHFRRRGFYEAVVGRGGEACDTTHLDTVKVAPFLRQPRQKPSTAVPRDDVRDVDAQRRRLRAAARLAALCSGREPPAEGFDERALQKWVDANAAEGALSSSTGGSRTAAVARRRQLQQTANALYSDVLSAQALQYNMEKLRDYVQVYGVFPCAFRPVIWRFAMGLPEVHVTAPQYAALARRPRHVCVDELMEAFPLPDGAMRRLLEKVLSNLAWHSPVFAMGRFLPALLFPLCHVYPQDPQRITEAALCLFNNWFRDYFSHYPSRPAHLVTFLVHVLQKTDPQLSQHLDDIGAGPDVWGWALLQNFCTDVLTSAEWLQVMDHALMLQPMWLFHFHVCLVVALRGPLFTCQSAKDVQARVFQEPHPAQVRIPDVIADACRAYHAHRSAAPALRSYYTFRDFGALFEYPVDFPCDMEVVREKIMHLDELAQLKAIEQEAAAQLTRDKAAAEEAHLSQQMALESQRVHMAAKYDASADIWRRRVLLERTREELEARQRTMHLQSTDDTVRHAEALQRLEEETAELYRQLGHSRVDQGREEYKWDLAARLTDQELTRLETEAQSHVVRSMQRLADGEQRQQDTHDALFARVGDVAEAPTSQPADAAPIEAVVAAEPAVVQPGVTHSPAESASASDSSPTPPPAVAAPVYEHEQRSLEHVPFSLERNESPPPSNQPSTVSIPRFIDPQMQVPMPPVDGMLPPEFTTSQRDAAPQPPCVPQQLPPAQPTPYLSHVTRVQTPPRELLAPYETNPALATAAARLAPAVAREPAAKPPSALQQLYERMKRAAAASVTTSSSAGSSVGRASAPRDARTHASPHQQRLHDNLDGVARAVPALPDARHWQPESDSSTLTTTTTAASEESESQVTARSYHTSSTYSVGQVLERPRDRNVREYTY